MKYVDGISTTVECQVTNTTENTMKVKIGPYLKWWGPYQIAELLKYVGFKEETHEKIGAYLADTKFNTLCEWAHSKRKRKVKVQLDKYDAWDASHTLALIALPLLKQLKEKTHGAPIDMQGFNYCSTNQWPQTCFEFYKEDDALADKAGFAEWGETLDKMIWSFEQVVDDDALEKERCAEYHARVQEGLELFGKYYQSLWD